MRRPSALVPGLRGCGLAALVILAGCGGDEGPPRYSLSGTVTFEGESIPFGWMIFAPENGPGATANIEDGKYHTPPGWGTVGGPHTIEVVAFGKKPEPQTYVDGAPQEEQQGGFSCTLQRDIPKEASTWDIQITREDLQQQPR